MENVQPARKRGFVLAVIAACAMAFVLAMSMTSTAMASTKAPYAGYKSDGETWGAGYISMSTYDTRNVKSGYDSFTVWSGNSKVLNSDDKLVAAKKAFKKLKGMSYSKKTNTLTLKNVKAPKYTLNLRGMGTGFKIKVKGTNKLSGIYCEAIDKRSKTGDYTGKYYPSSVRIDGPGKLVLNKTKYHGSAITLYGSNTKSRLVITKNPTVKLFAYGTGNVISVWDTTVKSAAKAVKIAGAVSQDLIQGSGKTPGYTTYKTDQVVIAKSGNARTEEVYSIGGKRYRFEDYSSSDGYWLERVDKVGSTSFYAPTGSSKYVSELPSLSSKVKVLDPDDCYSTFATLLNKGAYYGIVDSSSGYYDTKARRYRHDKWTVYKKAAKIDGTTYVTLAKKGVKDKKGLPKGYKGVKESTRSDTYDYVVKNSSLTAARI